MKKTVKRLQQFAALLCTAAFLFTLFGTAAAVKAFNLLQSDEECLAEMAQETADYMRSKGLQITNSAYSFANNNGEKVYALNSTDAVKAGSSFNRTQTVIQYKNREGLSEFYVINLGTQPDRLSYTVSRNSELYDLIDVPIGGVPGPGGPCAGALTQSQVDSILANLLAQANSDCKNRGTCLFQMMGGSCAYVMYLIKPTSWRCRIRYPVDVALAVDRAIANTAVFAP
jgi:hypothetical protein